LSVTSSVEGVVVLENFSGVVDFSGVEQESDFSVFMGTLLLLLLLLLLLCSVFTRSESVLFSFSVDGVAGCF